MKPAYFLLFFATLVACALAQNKVRDRSLLRTSNTNIIVSFTGSRSSVYGNINSRTFPSRGAKIQALKRGLETATRRSHQAVLRGLRRFNVETKSFWLTNQIYIRGANPRVVSYLNGLSNVKSIRLEKKTRMQPIRLSQAPPPNGDPEWGVAKIGADKVWPTTRGEGVRICIIDTGVLGSHEALNGNFVGMERNGWYDAINQEPQPVDNDGHGTHCAGVTCGQDGIGVAPGAEWMACRACDEEGCSDSALLACGQFALCPHDPNGENTNCEFAPHVTSNSWGGGKNDDSYDETIAAYNAAGIFSAFAAGNEGDEGCSSAGSPGDRNITFSVGATDEDDMVAPFSSKGPGPQGDNIVPTLVAPGVQIKSSYHTGDDAYEYLDGTSMATPHVAGAAALIRSAHMSITPQEIRRHMITTTVKNLPPTGEECGGIPEDQYPNNIAGYGRLDAEAAFNSAQSSA